MKAMILAAGKGTRMKPLTDLKPKALLEVCGVTLLEHSILYLRHFGVNQIIINVHHHSEQVIDFIRGLRVNNVDISVSDESEALLDTGGGLVKASWFFDDGMPFVLTACDVITDLDIREMYDYHMQKKPVATLASKQRTSTRDLLFDSNNRLCGWRNNVNGETRMSFTVSNPVSLSFSGIHVIDPEIFSLLDYKGPFSITDAYLKIAADHRVIGFIHNNSRWLEFGRIENFNNPDNQGVIKEIYKKYH